MPPRPPRLCAPQIVHRARIVCRAQIVRRVQIVHRAKAEPPKYHNNNNKIIISSSIAHICALYTIKGRRYRKDASSRRF